MDIFPGKRTAIWGRFHPAKPVTLNVYRATEANRNGTCICWRSLWPRNQGLRCPL